MALIAPTNCSIRLLTLAAVESGPMSTPLINKSPAMIEAVPVAAAEVNVFDTAAAETPVKEDEALIALAFAIALPSALLYETPSPEVAASA